MDLKAVIQQLADLHRDCMAKAEDFEAETRSRGEELKALAGAKRVIKEATGGAEEIAYGSTQMSFFQRSRIASSADRAHLEVVRFVRELARRQNLAKTLSARGAHDVGDEFWFSGPFAEVNNLISGGRGPRR